MKNLFIILALILIISSPCMAVDWTIDSNPDGKIGSLVWTIGGNIGSGSLKEKIYGEHPDRSTTSSRTLLSQFDCPVSRKMTIRLQLDYLYDKTGIYKYWQDEIKEFKAGLYLRFFSK